MTNITYTYYYLSYRSIQIRLQTSTSRMTLFIRPFQLLIDVILSNNTKCCAKVTFSSPLLKLNGPIFKLFRLLKVYLAKGSYMIVIKDRKISWDIVMHLYLLIITLRNIFLLFDIKSKKHNTVLPFWQLRTWGCRRVAFRVHGKYNFLQQYSKHCKWF